MIKGIYRIQKIGKEKEKRRCFYVLFKGIHD